MYWCWVRLFMITPSVGFGLRLLQTYSLPLEMALSLTQGVAPGWVLSGFQPVCVVFDYVSVTSNPAISRNLPGHRPDRSQPGALAPGKDNERTMNQAEGLKEYDLGMPNNWRDWPRSFIHKSLGWNPDFRNGNISSPGCCPGWVHSGFSISDPHQERLEFFSWYFDIENFELTHCPVSSEHAIASNGICFYRLEAGDFQSVQKMMLVKWCGFIEKLSVFQADKYTQNQMPAELRCNNKIRANNNYNHMDCKRDVFLEGFYILIRRPAQIVIQQDIFYWVV